MSGILDRIVRRRRASASSRLGPPPSNGPMPLDGTTRANGVSSPVWTAPDPEPLEPLAPLEPLEPPIEQEPESGAAPELAELEPEQPELAPFIQRGRIRRRARYLRALREVQLRDLGGFLVELERFGRERPELVRAKLARALETDRELRGLERALGSEQPLRELREPGIGGGCEHCGAVHGSSDHFCAACGKPLIAARPPGPGAPDEAGQE